MHELYGFDGSGSAAIEMALGVLKAPYRMIEVASWEPGTPIHELGRLNPLEQIPTLVLPDGTVLTESAAILLHLALENPESGLLPSEPRRRARAIQALIYIATNCYSAVGIVDFPERWTSGTTEERAHIRAGSLKRLYRHWEIFADRFVADSLLGTEQPGALEFLAVTVSRMLGARGHLQTRRPEFHRLLETLEAHPSIAPVVARHWPDE